MKKKKRVVVIGGGTGTFSVLSGLKHYPVHLSAVITMADDGGSAGILREDFGVLPTGDVRRVLIALSESDNKTLAALFNYRFKEGNGLSGHAFGNLMLTALERLTGSFERAIEEAAKVLRAKGEVIPVTLTPTWLYAELENGKTIRGETNIDIPKHDGSLAIERVWLSPEAKINPHAREAIRDADLVIIGPGDLYSSIMPNLLVAGIPEALRRTRGSIAYMLNLTTKYGETNGFRASDFVRTLERYLGAGILDYVVASMKKPGAARLAEYEKEKAYWVEIDKENFTKGPKLILADLVRARGFVRHDPEKVAQLIMKLL